MNISTLPYYTNTLYTATQKRNVNFGNKNEIITQSTIVSSQEIAQCIEKLTNKTKFINKILGNNAKTTKPVSTKIGEADAFINMDKTQNGLTKIKIYSETNDFSYTYSTALKQIIPIIEDSKHEQCIEAIINDKDGHMIYGILDCDAGNLHFERDPKTGKRNGTGQGLYPFKLTPNIDEEPVGWETQCTYANKSGNTVSAVLSALFMDLMRLKPDIKLI